MISRIFKKSLLFVIALALGAQFGAATAQDIVVENTTISTSETFSTSGAVTVGPGVTITNTGTATFAANRTSFRPQFFVANGGKMFILSGMLPTSVEPVGAAMPKEFSLQQNYPNPFNPSTTIQFDLIEAGHVSLNIYNSVGQLVRTLVSDDYAPGAYKVVWDARDDVGRRVASGVYLYKIKVGAKFTAQRKLMLMK